MKTSEYPFTKEAAENVRKAGYSLESLLEKTSFKSARSRAAERVQGAIEGQIPDQRPNTDAERLSEMLSYPLARVMVSCLDDQQLLRRYALAEAKLAFRRLQKEKEDLIFLANDLGLHPQGNGPCKLHFSEYIRFAHGMHSPKWKLVNKDLQEGYLTITEEELKRLLEDAVRERVMKGLPLKVEEGICTALMQYLDPIKQQLKAIKSREREYLGKVEAGAFPPCVKNMLADISSGKNLAHSARFALVSFLLQINMPFEEIIGLFNISPDFDEERTRYQVEHIAGASGTAYKPPSCATMLTYGNCPGEDDLCRRIRHPLSYYERRIRLIAPHLPAEEKK
jgi:DNA primase large subunit